MNMSDNRYRLVYGETHDSVHISDDETRRRFYSLLSAIDELNLQNEIIGAMLHFLKENGNELIRVENNNDVRWVVTTPENIMGYTGEVDIKTYDEYIESIKKK